LAIAACVAAALSIYVVAAVLFAIILFGLRLSAPTFGVLQVGILVVLVVGEFAFRGPWAAVDLVVFLVVCCLMVVLSRRRPSPAGA